MDHRSADPIPRGITRWLRHASPASFVAYTIVAAFGVYFCMYAFRKPFDAVKLTGYHFLGTRIELKTACVISQIIGYMLSKYLGTKICSEIRPSLRAALLVGLVCFALGGLFLFAVAPNDWKPLAMFINGIPLGMVWGLVVRYLEGRRSSELLVAGLSCSYIIAGAATRDIGRDIVIKNWSITEVWMPFVTASLFLLPMIAMVWLLDRVPAPSAEDELERSPREAMGGAQRLEFLYHFGAGFVLLLIAYFFLTAFRDFRDHYAAEMFTSLGLGEQRAIFSKTERWAMLGAVAAIALLSLIADNRRALYAVFFIIIAGFVMIGVATIAFRDGVLAGNYWMILVGVGMYLAYVPYGAVLFERMMAVSRLRGTSVFAIQLADGIGYTGSVLVQLWRDLFHGGDSRLDFFVPFALIVSVVGGALMLLSGILVIRRAGQSAERPIILEAPGQAAP